MRKQEIFNTVVTHLLTQNRKSEAIVKGKSSCAYRGRNGLKCAVGVLIPDAVYSKKMEGHSADLVVDQYPSLAFLKRNTELLMELQMVHDGGMYPNRWWMRSILRLAKEHKLKVPKILKDRLDAVL